RSRTPPDLHSFPTRRSSDLGRGLASDLLLLDPGVSRSHARIRAEDGSHLLLDIGSSNGTALNGVPVQGAAGLSPGDRIGVGPLRSEEHTSELQSRSDLVCRL